MVPGARQEPSRSREAGGQSHAVDANRLRPECPPQVIGSGSAGAVEKVLVFMFTRKERVKVDYQYLPWVQNGSIVAPVIHIYHFWSKSKVT